MNIINYNTAYQTIVIITISSIRVHKNKIIDTPLPQQLMKSVTCFISGPL